MARHTEAGDAAIQSAVTLQQEWLHVLKQMMLLQFNLLSTRSSVQRVRCPIPLYSWLLHLNFLSVASANMNS